MINIRGSRQRKAVAEQYIFVFAYKVKVKDAEGVLGDAKAKVYDYMYHVRLRDKLNGTYADIKGGRSSVKDLLALLGKSINDVFDPYVTFKSGEGGGSNQDKYNKNINPVAVQLSCACLWLLKYVKPRKNSTLEDIYGRVNLNLHKEPRIWDIERVNEILGKYKIKYLANYIAKKEGTKTRLKRAYIRFDQLDNILINSGKESHFF